MGGCILEVGVSNAWSWIVQLLTLQWVLPQEGAQYRYKNSYNWSKKNKKTNYIKNHSFSLDLSADAAVKVKAGNAPNIYSKHYSLSAQVEYTRYNKTKLSKLIQKYVCIYLGDILSTIDYCIQKNCRCSVMTSAVIAA